MMPSARRTPARAVPNLGLARLAASWPTETQHSALLPIAPHLKSHQQGLHNQMGQFAILHIEDDDNDVFLFQRAWKRAQVPNPVHVVCSGAEAIQYLEGEGKFSDRALHPFPCVIVMDIQVHSGNNCDFIRWLRAHPRFKTLVVVVLSGTSYQARIDDAYLAGANSFLLKPTDAEHLEALVRLIKIYWVDANQPPAECFSAGHLIQTG